MDYRGEIKDWEERVLWTFFFFFNNLLYFVCMDVLPAYAPHMCLVPEEAKRDVRASGTRGIESCEPPCGSWESVLGPLEEQSMPLTT